MRWRDTQILCRIVGALAVAACAITAAGITGRATVTSVWSSGTRVADGSISVRLHGHATALLVVHRRS